MSKDWIECNLERKEEFDKLYKEFLEHDFLFSIRELIMKKYPEPTRRLCWLFFNFLKSKEKNLILKAEQYAEKWGADSTVELSIIPKLINAWMEDE